MLGDVFSRKDFNVADGEKSDSAGATKGGAATATGRPGIHLPEFRPTGGALVG